MPDVGRDLNGVGLRSPGCLTGLEQAERFGAGDRLRLRCCAELAVQLAHAALNGVQRDVELGADLASGEPGCEASQHGELGWTEFFDEAAVSSVRSGCDEGLLDRRGDRG